MSLLVDSSQTDFLHNNLGIVEIVVGDLILAEVLQGFRDQRDFMRAKTALLKFQVIEMLGENIAIESAIHYRTLRTMGITVRKTIDCLIATRCLEDNLTLLHADKDYDPFEQHLGLLVLHP